MTFERTLPSRGADDAAAARGLRVGAGQTAWNARAFVDDVVAQVRQALQNV